MDGRMDGRTNGGMMDGWMLGGADEWTDGWMDGRTDGRTDGWMDGYPFFVTTTNHRRKQRLPWLFFYVRSALNECQLLLYDTKYTWPWKSNTEQGYL
jgi:hypothetical protein